MWLSPPVKTTLSTSVNNLSFSNPNLFDDLKLDLSHQEAMDTIIGRGGLYCGCYNVTDGVVTAIRPQASNEVEIDISFTFTSVSRSDGSFVGDTPKKCAVTLQVNAQSGDLTGLTFPIYQII